METMHGRKVVRHGKKGSMKKANKRFLIYTLVVFLIGFVLGCLIWGVTHKQKTVETVPMETETEANVELMEHVNQFGSIDERVFINEISMDWQADQYADEFHPLNVNMDRETQEFVFYLCKGYNIDWTLVMAMIQQESSFRSNVISATGDYGLMQINQMNHQWLTDTIGVTDFLDSKQNIRAGVFVLRKLFEEYSDPELVLMAYNMGENGAAKLWEKGIYSISYSESILNIKKQFDMQVKQDTTGN